MPSDPASVAAVPPDGHAREPEKLRLPAAAVERLVRLALRTQLGEEWWDGFATAHGRPSWLAAGRFRVGAQDAVLLPADAGGEG